MSTKNNSKKRTTSPNNNSSKRTNERISEAVASQEEKHTTTVKTSQLDRPIKDVKKTRTTVLSGRRRQLFGCVVKPTT